MGKVKWKSLLRNETKKHLGGVEGPVQLFVVAVDVVEQWGETHDTLLYLPSLIPHQGPTTGRENSLILIHTSFKEAPG